MEERRDFCEEARALFLSIAADAQLSGTFSNEAPVDVLFKLPRQKGLSLPISLMLQNLDELHFAGTDWQFCWFPFRDVDSDFREAVTGFLKGQYRVKEYWRGNRFRGGKLQGPSDSGWQTLASCQEGFSFPWPPSSPRYLVNKRSDH